MDTTRVLYHLPQFIHYNNNDNNQYKVINHLLYINILLAYKFDIIILLLVSKKVVNQLWQIIYKLIKTCKSILNATIGLCQRRLYNNNNNILLVY